MFVVTFYRTDVSSLNKVNRYKQVKQLMYIHV